MADQSDWRGRVDRRPAAGTNFRPGVAGNDLVPLDRSALAIAQRLLCLPVAERDEELRKLYTEDKQLFNLVCEHGERLSAAASAAGQTGPAESCAAGGLLPSAAIPASPASPASPADLATGSAASPATQVTTNDPAAHGT